MSVTVTLTCWVTSLLIWRWNRYAFRHPTTRLVPLPLRHTWFAGLSIITAVFVFCLPILLTRFWLIGALTFAVLLFLRRKRSIQLLIDDLKLHRMDKRGLFRHSEDCYMMLGGKTATFVKKRCERLWSKRANRLFK